MDKPLRRITVGRPLLQVDGEQARLSVMLQLPQGPTELWFSVPAAHADKLSAQTTDGFVIAISAYAAVRGLDIRVEGPMSARLFHSLNGPGGELLATLIPGARRVRVSADTLCTTGWGGTQAFAGFSAGIDSFCTFVQHTRPETPPELKLGGLFFNNVGSHGPSHVGARMYALRKRRIHGLAAQLGLPLVTVSSNLDAILGVPFQLTHTLRNVAVALLFQRVCGTFLYSSLVHFRDARVRDVPDMSYADTVLLPLLRTETVTCMSAGSEYTRFDKTQIVSELPLSHQSLDVCVSEQVGERTNCSVCWKCLRTQLTLEILGALDRYTYAFDIARYRRCRTAFIASVLQSNDALLREIREQIQLRGFPVPLAARCLRLLLPPAALRAGLRAYAQRVSKRDLEARPAQTERQPVGLRSALVTQPVRFRVRRIDALRATTALR